MSLASLLLLTTCTAVNAGERDSWPAFSWETVPVYVHFGKGSGPLTEQEMGELVRGMVQGIDDDVLSAITTRANGIPLYAVELVRMLIADGDLEVADDACCKPTRDLSSRPPFSTCMNISDSANSPTTIATM